MLKYYESSGINGGVIVANAPIRDYVPEVLMEDKNNKDEEGKPLKTRTAAFNKEEVNFCLVI